LACCCFYPQGVWSCAQQERLLLPVLLLLAVQSVLHLELRL